MSSHDKSHRTPRRKRTWRAQRMAMLVVAVIGVIAASWLAPELNRPAPVAPATAPVPITQPVPPPLPALASVEVAADLAAPPAPRARRTSRRRGGVPLDAAGANEADGYEILGAAELDGISQAEE
ncbi:MAG: hypothetical protein ACT4OF_02635 [Caulobacteraceae bacterium]